MAAKIIRKDLNAVFDNVVARYNARQGMSINDAERLHVSQSDFSYTGQADQTFGFVGPGAGVDIEPDYDNSISTSIKTRHVTFDGCTFRASRTAQFIIGNSNYVESILITRSNLDSRGNGLPEAEYPLWALVDNLVVEKSEIHTGNRSTGRILFTCPEDPNCASNTATRAVLRDSTIRSKGWGLGIHSEAQIGVFWTSEKNSTRRPVPRVYLRLFND